MGSTPIGSIVRQGLPCAEEGATHRTCGAPTAAQAGCSGSYLSMAFGADALTDGRRIRFLPIVDDFSRERLGIEVDTSLAMNA